MVPSLSASAERWPLERPFRISRGVKDVAAVVVAEARASGCVGRGEGVPYARYGETVDGVLRQILDVQAASGHRLDGRAAAELLPAGAALNAIDCAFWDLEARLSGRTVSDRLGAPRPEQAVTAVTISLDTIDAMAEAARVLADAPLLKVKVSAEEPAARIRAVAAAAPQAKLIVDPNESWDLPMLAALQPLLAESGAVLVEQPLPAAEDHVLEGFTPSVPICADESVHTADDLAAVARRYQAINIKLDKAGGLTGALRLRRAAAEHDLKVMVGCMICTSLSIAPALHVPGADYYDLDGPLWLRRDRAGGVRGAHGVLRAPAQGFWGEALSA